MTGRLAASIAHEINNPLEAVTNLLYLIRGETDRTAVEQYLTLADQELARVTEITKHTLRFYREPNQPVPVDVVGIVDSVLTLYGSRLLAAQVKVCREVPTEGVVIETSPGELRQIIANIVGNALDAMRVGGKLRIRVAVETDWRGGWEGRTRRRARLSVGDTGTGIAAELLPSIFEPFITTKGETGTGLGLWVTAELVKKNRWTVTVRSRCGEGARGTVFSILMGMG